MRRILNRGTIFGCALMLLMCAAAWSASAGFAADSLYWTSYTNSGGLRFGDLGGSGAHDLFTGESSPDGVAIDPAAGKIYWADTTSGAIRVANLNHDHLGTTCVDFLGAARRRFDEGRVLGIGQSRRSGDDRAFRVRARSELARQPRAAVRPANPRSGSRIGFASHPLTASVSGLIPDALYHVRLVATNSAGVAVGPDQTFRTKRGPNPPAPALGRTVDAAPVSGKVFVLAQGRLVPLTEATQIRAGAVIDALRGTLSLTSATGGKKKTQTGDFGGAVFKVTQEKAGPSKGLTTLTLLNSAFKGAPSYATCKSHKALDASVAAANTKTLQLLHASAHGKFRTSGRYSAATVRGTRWTIADRCDGTFIRDLTHSVAVTDFARHKTIILHAGQSYLARKPR